MARGPKKHYKRIRAPKNWLIHKLGGLFTVRPSQGPHKLRECLPLHILLKHRLKYALNYQEVTQILADKEANVKVDGKTRRDRGYPTGIMDVVTIEKTNEKFRILYDVKGRFVLKPIKDEEAEFKLMKVTQKKIGPNKIPYISTNDAHTIRFPHPDIEIRDTIKYNIKTQKIVDFVKFESGNVCFVTAGNNVGRIGVIHNIEKHPGSFDIVHVKDANGKDFATRAANVLIIGKGKKPWISLPKGNGLYYSTLDEMKRKEQKVKN